MLQRYEFLKAGLVPVDKDSLVDEDRSCDICMTEFGTPNKCHGGVQELPVRLPCGHVFGEWCIMRWFHQQHDGQYINTCPNDRSELYQHEEIVSDPPQRMMDSVDAALAAFAVARPEDFGDHWNTNQPVVVRAERLNGSVHAAWDAISQPGLMGTMVSGFQADVQWITGATLRALDTHALRPNRLYETLIACIVPTLRLNNRTADLTRDVGNRQRSTSAASMAPLWLQMFVRFLVNRAREG